MLVHRPKDLLEVMRMKEGTRLVSVNGRCPFCPRMMRMFEEMIYWSKKVQMIAIPIWTMFRTVETGYVYGGEASYVSWPGGIVVTGSKLNRILEKKET
jgi:hypothetical protein